ncbi:hypothetical protein ES703_100192 [subsurface metagenome]
MPANLFRYISRNDSGAELVYIVQGIDHLDIVNVVLGEWLPDFIGIRVPYFNGSCAGVKMDIVPPQIHVRVTVSIVERD